MSNYMWRSNMIGYIWRGYVSNDMWESCMLSYMWSVEKIHVRLYVNQCK